MGKYLCKGVRLAYVIALIFCGACQTATVNEPSLQYVKADSVEELLAALIELESGTPPNASQIRSAVASSAHAMRIASLHDTALRAGTVEPKGSPRVPSRGQLSFAETHLVRTGPLRALFDRFTLHVDGAKQALEVYTKGRPTLTAVLKVPALLMPLALMLAACGAAATGEKAGLVATATATRERYLGAGDAPISPGATSYECSVESAYVTPKTGVPVCDVACYPPGVDPAVQVGVQNVRATIVLAREALGDVAPDELCRDKAKAFQDQINANPTGDPVKIAVGLSDTNARQALRGITFSEWADAVHLGDRANMVCFQRFPTADHECFTRAQLEQMNWQERFGGRPAYGVIALPPGVSVGFGQSGIALPPGATISPFPRLVPVY